MFTTQNAYSVFTEKGVFHLKGALYWLTTFYGKGVTPKLPYSKIKKSLMKLPVNVLDADVMGHPVQAYQNFVSHIVPDDFWAKICVNQRMGEINIPALIITGWYDTYLQGAIDDFIRMVGSPTHSKNRESCLIVGPWAHSLSQKFPGLDFGRKADFTLQFIKTLKWCDFWLKEDQEALKDFGKVKYFMMGKNEWREAQEWPPKNTHSENFYLSKIPNEKKRTHYKLMETLPEESKEIRYVYDPKDPVPFRGSHHLHDSSWVGAFLNRRVNEQK